MHSTLFDGSYTTMFRLFCYICEDDYNQVFPVEIEEDGDVATLKKRIKEEAGQTFHDVDAKLLVLWNKPVPFNQSLKETVNALSLGDNDLLQALDILSDVLSSVLEKQTVHIIVDCPPSGELLSLAALMSSYGLCSYQPILFPSTVLLCA